jgi:hypothetical protein
VYLYDFSRIYMCFVVVCIEIVLASHQRKKSNATLTPPVASPVRLFNDSVQTPLLELAIPEEKFQQDNKSTVGNEVNATFTNERLEESFQKGRNTNSNANMLSSENIEVSALNRSDGNNYPTESKKELSTDENVDTEVVDKTLETVQSEEFDQMAEMEAQLRASEKEEQSQALLDATVTKAKADAEVEAARIISRAMAEIAAAKEAAKKQLEMDDAVRKATRQVERETENKLKRLQRDADEEAAKTKKEDEAATTKKFKEEEEWEETMHEGDLYWDENDQVAGGNAMSEKKKNSDDIPPDFKTSESDTQLSDNTDVKEELSMSPASKSKSSRKSKIPKLKRSASSSSSSSSSTVNSSKTEDEVTQTQSRTEPVVSAKERKKAEARARIQLAKKEFKKKQAEDEANGNLMAFISMDEMEPTGGDELLPPTGGGDEWLPPTGGGDELLPDVNDDDSVASTTVDEEEFLPRKSASFPGQGSRPDTIRALREISQQREHMDKALAELQR